MAYPWGMPGPGGYPGMPYAAYGYPGAHIAVYGGMGGGYPGTASPAGTHQYATAMSPMPMGGMGGAQMPYMPEIPGMRGLRMGMGPSGYPTMGPDYGGGGNPYAGGTSYGGGAAQPQAGGIYSLAFVVSLPFYICRRF